MDSLVWHAIEHEEIYIVICFMPMYGFSQAKGRHASLVLISSTTDKGNNGLFLSLLQLPLLLGE